VDQGKNNKGTNVNAPVISDEDISDEEETPVQKVINCCTMLLSVFFYYLMIVLCTDYTSTYTWFHVLNLESGQEQQKTK
jgi:uncharacterized membrane protein YjgN (DUF898 family)